MIYHKKKLIKNHNARTVPKTVTELVLLKKRRTGLRPINAEQLAVRSAGERKISPWPGAAPVADN